MARRSMKKVRATAGIFAALALLAGCTTETAPTGAVQGAPATPATTGTGVARNAKPVTPARARALFDAICAASLNGDFATAPERLRANGFTRTSPLGSGTIYSQTENASFQIKDGPGFGKTCSMVVASQSQPATMRAALMVGKTMDTPFGLAGLYPNTGALVVEGTVKRDGGLTYFNYRLLSDRGR